MNVNLGTLKNLLLQNVCEIKFSRRRPVPGKPLTRRMLCTNSFQLLNSTNGRLALNYRPAVNRPAYNPTAYNIIITWDLFMQDYRCISMDQCELITLIPANELFWKYFREKLQYMSPQEKLSFMNQ